MDQHQISALLSLQDIGEALRRRIAEANSSLHQLALPADVVAKLIEAQQAVYAAQRLLDGC